MVNTLGMRNGRASSAACFSRRPSLYFSDTRHPFRQSAFHRPRSRSMRLICLLRVQAGRCMHRNVKGFWRGVSVALRPMRALNHCRSLSTKVIKAIGVWQMEEAIRAISSKMGSTVVSRIWYRRRASNRLVSLLGIGGFILRDAFAMG